MTKFRMLHPKENNASTCKPTWAEFQLKIHWKGRDSEAWEMLGKWLVNGDMNDKVEEKSDGPRVSHSKFRSFDRRRCCHSAGWAYSDPPICFTQQNQGHTPKETRLTQLRNPTAVRIPKVRRFSNNPHMFGAHFDCVETKWHTPKGNKKSSKIERKVCVQRPTRVPKLACLPQKVSTFFTIWQSCHLSTTGEVS